MYGTFWNDRGNSMDESINTANKKQDLQKPPLSIVRIAGEILAGIVIGVSVAVPVSYVILHGCMFPGEPKDWPEFIAFLSFMIPYVHATGEWGDFAFLVLFVSIISFLIMYVPAAVFGVYLVGYISKQTGSFLPTLGGGILGGLVMYLLFWKVLVYPLTDEKRVTLGLMLLIAPIIATLGFNLTRRYKEPLSS